MGTVGERSAMSSRQVSVPMSMPARRWSLILLREFPAFQLLGWCSSLSTAGCPSRGGLSPYRTRHVPQTHRHHEDSRPAHPHRGTAPSIADRSAGVRVADAIIPFPRVRDWRPAPCPTGASPAPTSDHASTAAATPLVLTPLMLTVIEFSASAGGLLRLARGAGPCRCGRHSHPPNPGHAKTRPFPRWRWRDALFEGPFGRSPGWTKLQSQPARGPCGFTHRRSRTTIHLVAPFNLPIPNLTFFPTSAASSP